MNVTFADHRKREDTALDFWYACQRAAARERAGFSRPCADCWHNDSCPPSRYCPSCQAKAEWCDEDWNVRT